MKNKTKEIVDQIKNILLKKAEGYFYNEEITEYISTEENNENNKKIQKTVSEQLDFINNDLKSNQKKGKNEKEKLMLSKKKITTHYIPPDLTAVKMLFEIFGQEVEDKNNLDNMSDQELLKLKNKLLNELKNIDQGG